MSLESIVELLEKWTPRLDRILKKSIIVLLTLVGGGLSAWLAPTIELKVILIVTWVILLLCIKLCFLLIVQKTKARIRESTLEADLRKARGQDLETEDWAILELLYQTEKTYSYEQLKAVFSWGTNDFKFALRKLSEKQLIVVPDTRRLIPNDGPDPNAIDHPRWNCYGQAAKIAEKEQEK